MTTYQELIDEAAEILRKPDLDAVLFSFLKQAETDLANNPIGIVPEWIVSATLALPAAAAEVALPSDFGRPASLQQVGQAAGLLPVSYRYLYENGYPEAFTAAPSVYAVLGTEKILFGGVFTEDTSWRLVYQKRPSRPVSAAADLQTPDRLVDAVMARLLHLGYLDQRDPLAVKWEGIWASRLTDALAASRRLQDNLPQTGTMRLTR